MCYLSVLTGVGLICFSQKFAKGGDCWIFVCWLHFCLKQIFTSDVEHNVPTSRPGLYVLFLCLDLRTCFLFKESFILVGQAACFYEKIRTDVIS